MTAAQEAFLKEQTGCSREFMLSDKRWREADSSDAQERACRIAFDGTPSELQARVQNAPTLAMLSLMVGAAIAAETQRPLASARMDRRGRP